MHDLEDNFTGLVLSLHLYLGSGDQTQTIKLLCKDFTFEDIIYFFTSKNFIALFHDDSLNVKNSVGFLLAKKTMCSSITAFGKPIPVGQIQRFKK